MKILIVSNLKEIAQNTAQPAVVCCADSSVLRPGEPLFLDDDYPAWQSVIAPAVRIGRLGLHVGEKFAGSYIDAHTLFHVRVPHAADHCWYISDRLFSPGKWLDGNFSGSGNVRVGVSAIGAQAKLQTFSLDIDSDDVCKAVSAISRYATIKTGDILVFFPPGLADDFKRNTELEAYLDDNQVLRLKIK